MPPHSTDPPATQTLGHYLSYARRAKKLSLRDVEELTSREVSNAYLSQLENGRIKKPSPNILHALSAAYGVPYETLMEKAGYLTASPNTNAHHGRAATFADKELTPEEEEELLRYLAFLRSKKSPT